MAHKFDSSQKSKLDSPKRREMLPVTTVLEEIGLKAEEKFADIGCGIGYFSIPAAEIVGSRGMVYALDVNKEMLEELKERIEEKKLDNISPILTEEYDFKLDDKFVSFVFVCTVIHEIDDKTKFLNEAKRILISGGKIAVVEWIKRESEWGPPVNHRIAHNDVKQMLKNSGFRDISEKELNEHFYIVTANL